MISLLTLPNEILHLIAIFIPLKDLSKLIQTCLTLNNTLEPYLHKHTSTHPIPPSQQTVLNWAAATGQLSLITKIDTHTPSLSASTKTSALVHATKHGQTIPIQFSSIQFKFIPDQA
ncbi:hypothetical protein BJX70DRAFT_403898 [Aspergillus crustosus]